MGVYAITSGPDGNLWFTTGAGTLPDDLRIGRMTTAGTAVAFRLPGAGNTEGFDVTIGPDGNLWFTELNGKVGRMTMSSPDLTIDFGATHGLWSSFDTGSQAPSWARLHTLSPSVLSRGDLDGNGRTDLAMTFPGYGVWRAD